MRMEIHIYSNVNVNSQVVNIWDITTTQKGQSQNKSEKGILKIYAFCQKIQQKTSGLGECCWCYVSIRMHPKNCCIFPLKVATTLLSGLRKGKTVV